MMPETLDLIVHGPPGSAPPVLAAALVEALAEAGGMDQEVRLVPRGDDPGVDAMHLLAQRPGDRHVVSTCTPVFLQAPLLRGMALTHRALTPLARLVSDHFFLVVREDSAWRDARGFACELATRPTRTGGYFKGGINHLLALSIASHLKAEVEFVVTESEPAVWQALIDGRIDWACGVAAELAPHLRAGAVRVIAALHDERKPVFPDVPTLMECGVPVTFTMWRGLMGPLGLAPEDQAAWHESLQRATRTRAWQTYLRTHGQTDSYLPGPAFAAFLDSEWDWYQHHFRLAGLLPAQA
jgi:putative tricarboxylic transport membrane protein